MTLAQFIIITSILTVLLSAYLFAWQWVRRDGIARLFFLIYSATFLISGLVRLIGQVLRQTDVTNPKEASYLTAFNVSISMLLPLIAIVAIIIFYNPKDKE